MNLTNCANAKSINKNSTDYTLYSCNKCINNNFVTLYKIIDDIVIMNCIEREGKLIRCSNATEDEDGNITCTKCVSNFPFVWSDEYNETICGEKCRYFEVLKEGWCYSCDDPLKGKVGCNASLGCYLGTGNNEFDCFGCKPGYFLQSFQCLECKTLDIHSSECHFEDKFYSDKCDDKYYINNETNKCELITYEEYPEITLFD